MSSNTKENNYKYGVRENKRKSVVSAILIGIGLAGLVDIIIFHQILQWASHNLTQTHS
jgi:uncharacterized membrane protein